MTMYIYSISVIGTKQVLAMKFQLSLNLKSKEKSKLKVPRGKISTSECENYYPILDPLKSYVCAVDHFYMS